MKDVQKLTLILVQTFYLYIKDGTGIYLDTVVLHDVLSQTHFVLVLDIHKLLLRFLIVSIDFQFVDLRQIRNPVISYMRGHPVRQKRIRMQQESSLGDAVCLVNFSGIIS